MLSFRRKGVTTIGLFNRYSIYASTDVYVVRAYAHTWSNRSKYALLYEEIQANHLDVPRNSMKIPYINFCENIVSCYDIPYSTVYRARAKNHKTIALALTCHKNY